MRIIVIGDIHGRDIWKTFPLNEFDKVIFIGDYTDSFDKTDNQIIENLRDIIQYKKDNMEKCVLLIGNHDLQYIFSYESNGCSGFRYSCYGALHILFQLEEDLFNPSYQIDNYLFTHAGVTSVWWNKFVKNIGEDKEYTISEAITKQYYLNNIDLFDVGRVRGGWCKSGGPFWADRSETTAWILPNYHQIVGHTPVKEIYTHEWKEGNASITYCDDSYDYYKLEI